MNFYIDFDSTLYNTGDLIETMLQSLAFEIHNQNADLDQREIFSEEKDLFNGNNIYNIFELCKHFANKHNLDTEKLILSINNVLNNGSDFVYQDSIESLQIIKHKGHNVNLLTYAPQDRIEYQIQKIYGSGLVKYFDHIIITSEPKWKLSLDYTNSIFIDDNPEEIAGLYKNKPAHIIRIKRDGNKYSSLSVQKDVQFFEYSSLEEFCKNFNFEII